jgi:hypothetical protein
MNKRMLPRIALQTNCAMQGCCPMIYCWSPQKIIVYLLIFENACNKKAAPLFGAAFLK